LPALFEYNLCGGQTRKTRTQELSTVITFLDNQWRFIHKAKMIHKSETAILEYLNKWLVVLQRDVQQLLQLDLIKAAEESCHEGVKIHWRLINQIYRFFTFLRQNNQILKQDTYQSFVAWYEAKAKDTLSKFYNSLTIKVDDANS